MSGIGSESRCIVTTGTFDGVHLGHQLLLTTLSAQGRQLGLRPVAVTFDRHPLSVIAPDRTPRMLLTSADRMRHIREYVPQAVEIAFDSGMCAMTSREWLRRLRDDIGADAVMMGYDNSFGSDCAGKSFDDYVAMARELGMQVVEAPQLPGISSSLIRAAIAAGNMEDACRMLGYSWFMRGRVTQGTRTGHEIGFPTANLEVPDTQLIPACGVYASTVGIPGHDPLPAVTNIGSRPTLDDGRGVTIETHIPGFDGMLYGKEITVTPLAKIRDEQKFDSLDQLRDRIARDVEESLKLQSIR